MGSFFYLKTYRSVFFMYQGTLNDPTWRGPNTLSTLHPLPIKQVNE
jgi:hypothetical protein